MTLIGSTSVKVHQQYAPDVALPVRQPRALQPRLPAAPAIAGRDLLARLMGRSLLARLSIAMACVFVAGVLYLAQASQISVREYDMQKLQSQNVTLTTDNAELLARQAALRSMPRVISIATTKLHMVRAAHPLWVTVQIPLIPAMSGVGTSAKAADARSDPLTWMRNFIDLAKAQL